MTVGEVRRRRIILKERLSVVELIKTEARNELQALQKKCPHENSKDEDFLEGSGTKTYTVCQDCGAEKHPFELNFPS